MNIKAIVLTCEKYHSTRVKTVNETWGKDVDTVFLSDVSEGKSIVGYSDVKADYATVFLKYLAFLKRYNDLTADWYIFCDDDTFLNIPNIKNLLKKYDSSENLVIGSKCTLNSDGTDAHGDQTGFLMHTIMGEEAKLPVQHPSGGAGFIITKNTFLKLKEYLKGNKNIGYSYKSDVTFGFWLNQINAKFIDIRLFTGNTPRVYRHTEEDIKNNLTYHYVNEELMKQLYARVAQR
ncbi:MAG: hypothetical protein EBU90_22195 [Proteobacteria bacterium]|nr:hypothetical protein [Pseudomonadota bacterium]NBP15614.1 hypothetical protein [bacterium]